MLDFGFTPAFVAILGSGRGIPVPPTGYRFLSETVSGVKYLLTESIGGATLYLMEAM